MAGESLFRELEIEAFRAGITPRTRQSIEWFKKKARQLFRGRVINNRADIMQDDALTQTTRVDTSFKGPIGNMYMYFYDAKHKKTLPYYDGFPLTIIMGPAPGGFKGVNLHYLHPVARARLLDILLGNGGKMPQKYLQPALKHYLTAHVKSRFALVDKPEWEIASFLPTANWQKADPRKVYRDTQAML